MSDFPAEAVHAWADGIAIIRDNGQQVSYSERTVPELRQRHDEMLRALLAWSRSAESAGKREGPTTAAFDHCEHGHRPLSHTEPEKWACPASGTEHDNCAAKEKR